MMAPIIQTKMSPEDVRWFQLSGADQSASFHAVGREYLYTQPTLYWRCKKAGKWSWERVTENNLQISIVGTGKVATSTWASSPEHFWLKCCLNHPYRGPGPILYAPQEDD